jgi:hypothetical protein
MPYTPVRFKDAHLKIERAREHMAEFDAYATKVFGREFAPYITTYELDSETGACIAKFMATDAIKRFAILCGDAIHNLRAALDFVWYELTSADAPPEGKRIRFPVYPTRKHLEDFIKARETQVSVVNLSGKLLDVIKPYKGGNPVGDCIYALHQLDIRDKHHLLIPQIQVSHVWGDDTEDSAKVAYGANLINTFGTKDQHQGELSASIIFGEGAFPVEGKPVSQTIRSLKTAVEVTIMLLA